MTRQGQGAPAEAGGARGGPGNRTPTLMTVALKPETYKELAELKSRYKFRSFDDVVKLLLSCERP